jgi:hypothetical protein
MIDMQTSLPLLIVRPSILNSIIKFSTHLWPVKWNALQIYLCLAHSVPSPPMLMQHMHQPITNDIIHFISSRDLVGSSILISLAFHHCLHPSAPSLAQASPPRGPSLQSLQFALYTLQPVHQAKSCLDLLHLSHMTLCHISYAISSFITCVSLAMNPSHLHRHSMSCSHKCTCGLIICVSHSNIY